MQFTSNGGPGATQLGYAPISTVADCENWAVLNKLDTVGLQYGGQCVSLLLLRLAVSS